MKFSFCLLSLLVVFSCVSGQEFINNEEASFDDVTNDILKYGVGFIFERAADKFGVSTDNVEITEINSVETEDLNNGWTIYRCDVDATNNYDARVEARFTIEYNQETDEKIVRRWRYHISYRHNLSEESQLEAFLSDDEEDDEWENAVDEFEYAVGEGEVNVEVEVEVEIAPGADDSDSDYEQVSEEEIQNDPIINDVLQFGAAFVFERAADNYGVSSDNVQITDVESVYRRDEDDNKTRYRCHIDATNNDDARLEARFTIEYDHITQEKVVDGWRYSMRYHNNDEEGAVNEEEGNFEYVMGASLDENN